MKWKKHTFMLLLNKSLNFLFFNAFLMSDTEEEVTTPAEEVAEDTTTEATPAAE